MVRIKCKVLKSRLDERDFEDREKGTVRHIKNVRVTVLDDEGDPAEVVFMSRFRLIGKRSISRAQPVIYLCVRWSCRVVQLFPFAVRRMGRGDLWISPSWIRSCLS